MANVAVQDQWLAGGWSDPAYLVASAGARAAATCTLTAPSAEYRTTILGESGLVSYWRLDEASGNALDSGTGANPATPTGGITRNVTGLLTSDINGAVQVDGVTNSYLEAPYKANMNVGSAITVECWVKLSAYVVGRILVAREASTTCWFLNQTANTAYRWYVRDTNNVDTIVQTSNTLVVGAVQHVVGVYDVAAGRCELYVNGVSVGAPNRTPNAAIQNSTSQNLDIGGDTYDGSMTGVIDEVALYNVALTADQILHHYGVGTATAPLRARAGATAAATATLTIPATVPAAITASAGVTAAATAKAASTFTASAGARAAAAATLFAGPAFIQSSGNYAGGTGATLTCSLAGVRAGNMLTIAVYGSQQVVDVAVSDSQGTSYATDFLADAVDLTLTGEWVGLFHGVAPVSGSYTFTLSTPSALASSRRLVVHEVCGANALDSLVRTHGIGSSCAIGPLSVTQQAQEYAFAWVVSELGATGPASAGWTMRQSVGSESTLDSVTAATGTLSATCGALGSDRWTALGATFYPGTGVAITASAGATAAATATLATPVPVTANAGAKGAATATPASAFTAAAGARAAATAVLAVPAPLAIPVGTTAAATATPASPFVATADATSQATGVLSVPGPVMFSASAAASASASAIASAAFPASAAARASASALGASAFIATSAARASSTATGASAFITSAGARAAATAAPSNTFVASAGASAQATSTLTIPVALTASAGASASASAIGAVAFAASAGATSSATGQVTFPASLVIWSSTSAYANATLSVPVLLSGSVSVLSAASALLEARRSGVRYTDVSAVMSEGTASAQVSTVDDLAVVEQSSIYATLDDQSPSAGIT